jgi:subtilisin-like proprotein convertase family protein
VFACSIAALMARLVARLSAAVLAVVLAVLPAQASADDSLAPILLHGELYSNSESRLPDHSDLDVQSLTEYWSTWYYCYCNGLYSNIWFEVPFSNASGQAPSSITITSVGVRGDLGTTDEYIDFKLSTAYQWKRYQGDSDSSVYYYEPYSGPQPSIVYNRSKGAYGFYIDLRISDWVNEEIPGVQGFFNINFRYQVDYDGGDDPGGNGGSGGTGGSAPPQPPTLDSIIPSKDTLTLNLVPPSSGGTPSRYLGYCERPAGTVNSSTSVATSIADNAYSNSYIEALQTERYVIGDVHGSVSITHSWRGDLELTLVSPALTWAIIWTGDELDSGTSLTHSFSLPDFNGQRADGTWRLQIQDRKTGDVGTLQSWNIRFDHKELVNGNTPWGTGTSVTSAKVSGLKNGATYLCYALTQAYNEAVSAASNTLSELVGGSPQKPIISVEPEESAVLITVSSIDDGGLPITEYEAECASADQTLVRTSESKSVLMSPMTDGVGYLCKARARNYRGWGPYSDDVKARPGELPPTGLPLWLMYQAYEINKSNSDSNSAGSGGSSGGESGTYCGGLDTNLAECSVNTHFDPWLNNTAAQAFVIRDKLTRSVPFTLPSRAVAENVEYGYLAFTTFEPARTGTIDDVFHVWFSTEPNGTPLEGTYCEKYLDAAEGSLYWTQDTGYQGICYLGESERLLYVNFETRCSPLRYPGICDDLNKNKSSKTYQFEVSRQYQRY